MRAVIPAVLAAAALAYLRLYRPWQLTWGATPQEVHQALPGDDLVADPTFDATRAITIAAPPHDIWPWLVQVGTTRAGWYSYDLLDNLGRRSAERLIPELQRLDPGDVVSMGPDGKQGIVVHSLDEPTSMVWGTPGDTSWAWHLQPRPDGATRLLTRIRSRVHANPTSLSFALLLEVADIWMLRKMLLGLRRRAEATSTDVRATLTGG